MIGTQDLILGALIVIVLFGAKRLPELMGALGKSMKEFKKGVSGDGEQEGQELFEAIWIRGRSPGFSIIEIWVAYRT